MPLPIVANTPGRVFAWSGCSPPAADEEEGQRGDAERGCVDDEGGTGLDERDHGARQRGTDEPHDLLGALHERVGRGELALGHEHRHDRVQGGVEEGIDHAERAGQHVEVPQFRPLGDHQCCQNADDHPADEVRREHEIAWREAIAEGAADEHEDGARDGGGHQHRAEREPGAGDLEGEPGEGHEVKLVSQHAHGLAGKEEPEVAERQRTEEPGAVARRLDGRGDADLGGLVHVLVTPR